MGDHQGRLDVVNLSPFVGVDLNLWPTVNIAVIVLIRTYKDTNKQNLPLLPHYSQPSVPLSILTYPPEPFLTIPMLLCPTLHYPSGPFLTIHWPILLCSTLPYPTLSYSLGSRWWPPGGNKLTSVARGPGSNPWLLSLTQAAILFGVAEMCSNQ